MRAAEAATTRFTDRAVADARRVAAAQNALTGPPSGGGSAGSAGSSGAPRVNASGRTAAQEAEARRLVETERRRQSQVDADARAAEAAARERARAEEERLRRQRDAMQDVGQGATAMGLAIAGGLLLSAKAAIEWETAWAGVTKTVDGTASQMQGLEDQLRGMAMTLPISHKELAGVAEAAGQLGIKREAIAGFTKTMVDLGVSTNLSAEDAATGIAQMMNVMQTAPANVGRFGAALVALGNDGASTEREILDMSQRLSGAGRLIGASESGVLALANAMASVGIQSELGGGAMSRTLQHIYTAVKTAGPELAGFARIAGMSANQFATSFEQKPMEAVNAFIGGLGRIKDSGGNVIQALDGVHIKGTQNLQVLLRLAGAGDLLSHSLDVGSAAWDRNTALTDEAAKRYDTVASKLKVLKNNAFDLAIQIGDVLLPIIVDMTEAGQNVIGFFQSMPGPVREVSVVLVGLGGALGLVGGALLLTAPRIVATRTALQTLAATAMWTNLQARMLGMTRYVGGPWVAAFGLATLAIGALALKHKTAHRPIEDLTEAIKADTGALGDNTREAIVNRLQKQGALDLADKYRISTQDLTDATMDNADAQARVNTAIATARGDAPARMQQLRELIATSRDLGTVQKAQFELQHLGNSKTMIDLDALSAAVNANAGDTRKATAADQQRAGALGKVGDAAAGASGGTGKLAGAMKGLAAEAGFTEANLKKLNSELSELLSDSFDAEKATIDYRDQLAALAQQIRDARDAGKGHAASLDAQTAAGRDNIKSVMSLVEAQIKRLEQDSKVATSTEEISRKAKQYKRDLEDQLVAMGLSREGARRYTDVLLQVPAIVKTNIQVDTGTAMKKVADFTADYNTMLNRIKDKQVRIDLGVSDAAYKILTKNSYGLAGEDAAHANRAVQRGFAVGGAVQGPGGPTEDAIPAWLSNGEYVINAAATARHRDLLDSINAGYARGGPVISHNVTMDRGSLDAQVAAAGDYAYDRAVSVGRAGAAIAEREAARARAAAKAATSNAGLGGALSWARNQVGKPYVWGGVGPGGFDCSGFMGSIENVIQGKSPNQRRFATASFAGGKGAAGFVPGGGGAFSIGVHQASGSVPGHMAGTLNGVNVESRGGRGVVVGSGARGAGDRLFARQFHLAGYAGGGQVGRSLTPIRGGGGARPAIPVALTLNVTGTDIEMKQMMRRIVRTDGRGDVQLTFGTG
jgi:TP901 family phage tail tape measure protein